MCIIIAAVTHTAITFNEDLTVYHNFHENILFFNIFINLEIEMIFQCRMGYGTEKISWVQ